MFFKRHPAAVWFFVVFIVLFVSMGFSLLRVDAAPARSYYECPAEGLKYDGLLGHSFTTTDQIVAGTEEYYDQHCLIILPDGTEKSMPSSEITALIRDYNGLTEAEVADAANESAVLGFVNRPSHYAWDLTQLSVVPIKGESVVLDIVNAVAMWVETGEIGDEEKWLFRYFVKGSDEQPYIIDTDGHLIQVEFTCPEIDIEPTALVYDAYHLNGIAQYNFEVDTFFCGVDIGTDQTAVLPLDHLLMLSEMDGFILPVGETDMLILATVEVALCTGDYHCLEAVETSIVDVTRNIPVNPAWTYAPFRQLYRGIFNLQYGIYLFEDTDGNSLGILLNGNIPMLVDLEANDKDFIR